MRIDKKTKKENHYNEAEHTEEVKKKKAWPQDLPIKTFRPVEPTERTKEEERYDIDAGLS